MKNVVVLGASPKESRYSNQAVRELVNYGHRVYPVHPHCTETHGQKCYRNLSEIANEIDTLTLYVGEERSSQLVAAILAMKPNRIIMNPGAENDFLAKRATETEIEVVRGCTLVMLRTGLF